jgi:two-component system CheB/CheR fusion protein
MWSAGCSTGEEAYSLAITAREVIERVNPGLQLQVFATDLDDRAIDTARRGVYLAGIAADMSEERLQYFFIREEDCYRIRKDLREQVIFAPQNIISDPPFTKLDVLCCRNVLIYMDAVPQTRLLPVFHYSLRPDGLLFPGSSESINEQKDLFLTRDKKWRLS